MAEFVWVFVGEGAQFPSAIFTDLNHAEVWVHKHSLSGTLSKYPVGQGVYEWAVSIGAYQPKPTKRIDAKFIGRFTSASMEHIHFENGEKMY